MTDKKCSRCGSPVCLLAHKDEPASKDHKDETCHGHAFVPDKRDPTKDKRSVRRQFFDEFLIVGTSRCGYCKCLLDRDTSKNLRDGATVDHVVPTYLGGLTVFENLMLACHWCNNTKSCMSAAEFAAWRKFVGTYRIPTFAQALKAAS